MLTFDERSDFPFLCVSDETQAIFRAYSVVCTPGFFVGFNTLLPKAQPGGSLDALQEPPILPEIQRNLPLRGA
jgi:hypothetical protein